MGLVGEAGELANLIKKHWRGDLDGQVPAVMEAWHLNCASELADIRIYLNLVCQFLDVDLDDAVDEKLAEVEKRWNLPPGERIQHMEVGPEYNDAWCGVKRMDHDVMPEPNDVTCLACLQVFVRSRNSKAMS